MSEDHPVEQVAPAKDDVGAAIEKWFNDKFPGSLVARDVDVWNFVRAAVEELKQRLKSRG